MKHAFIALALLIADTAGAQDRVAMISVAASESGATYWAKEGSRTETNGVIEIEGVEEKPGRANQWRKWRVSRSDCDRERGYLWEYTMEGEQLHRNDFALRTNVTAGRLAQYICWGRVGKI